MIIKRVIKYLAAISVFLLVQNPAMAQTYGIDRFEISGTRMGVLRAIADGNITDQLIDGGLHDQLEEQWPASDPHSPTDVFVNIYAGNFFVKVYVAKIQISRSGGDSWEVAITGGVEMKEASMNGQNGGGSIMPEQSIAELMMNELLNTFPPNSVIVINPGGGNGNWCGPGTPWICVYSEVSSAPFGSVSDPFGGPG